MSGKPAPPPVSVNAPAAGSAPQQPPHDRPAAVSRASSATGSEIRAAHAAEAAVAAAPESPVLPVSAMGAPPTRLRSSSLPRIEAPSPSAVAVADRSGPQDRVHSGLDWALYDQVSDEPAASVPLAVSRVPAPHARSASAFSASAGQPAFNLLDEPSLQVNHNLEDASGSRSWGCAYGGQSLPLCTSSRL